MYNKLKGEREERVSYHNDEIDLHYVFSKIGSGFKFVFDKILYVFKVTLNRAQLILFFILIGLGVGFLVFKFTKPYYTSSMTLILSDIRNEFIEDQLDKLSDMINEDNFEAVSERLDINVQSARQIKGMKFFNLDQDRVSEDSILTGSPFRIELMLYNNELFLTMEPALTNYLENNPYFSKQKRIRQQQMLSMISKYKSEIESLDSVKTAVVNPRGPVSGFVYGQPIDPSNLYRESVGMFQKQVELEAELEQMDNVQVVTGFITKLSPTGPNLIKYLLVSAVLSFIVGIVVALALESKKRQNMPL